jgi:hypothetical protein
LDSHAAGRDVKKVVDNFRCPPLVVINSRLRRQIQQTIPGAMLAVTIPAAILVLQVLRVRSYAPRSQHDAVTMLTSEDGYGIHSLYPPDALLKRNPLAVGSTTAIAVLSGH